MARLLLNFGLPYTITSEVREGADGVMFWARSSLIEKKTGMKRTLDRVGNHVHDPPEGQWVVAVHTDHVWVSLWLGTPVTGLHSRQRQFKRTVEHVHMEDLRSIPGCHDVTLADLRDPSYPTVLKCRRPVGNDFPRQLRKRVLDSIGSYPGRGDRRRSKIEQGTVSGMTGMTGMTER